MPDELAGIDEVIGDLSRSSKRSMAKFTAPSDPELELVALELMRSHKVLTVDEVSHILRWSRRTTYRGVWDGDIPSVKIGRRILIPVEGLRAMLGEIDEPQPHEAASEAA